MLKISPLDHPVGAIVEGWQPDRAMSESERNTIAEGLREHIVLIFRGNPQPSDDALINFASSFGDLVKGSEWFQDIGPRPEVLRVNNVYGDDGVAQGTGRADKLGWHAGYAYVPRVGKESFLNAVELPQDRPRTCLSNQYRALETLPASVVEELRTLRAFHSITRRDNEEGDNPDATRSREVKADFIAKRQRNRELGFAAPDIPQAEHPLIIEHIIGMPADESDALLKELRLHSVAKENVYCHDWQVGDLVMFDTLGSLHRRDSWDPSQRRVMRQLSTMV